MMKFTDLVPHFSNVDVAEQRRVFDDVDSQQDRATELFKAVLSASNFDYWNAGDPIVQVEIRFLVGVSPWSRRDMQMLDALNPTVLKKFPEARVDIFDYFASCLTQAQLDLYIPQMDITKIFHTPVLGQWTEGILTHKCSGYEARKWLEREFTFNIP